LYTVSKKNCIQFPKQKMAKLEITITQSDLDRAFAGITDRANNLAPALDEVGQYLLLETRDRFDKEVDPEGRAWAELKPKTIERKRKKGRQLGKLKEFGTLRDTINYQVNGNSLSIGSPQKYAKFHQQPQGPGKGIIPRRAFLGINDRNEQRIIQIIRDYLLDG
jgi:phage virion morphogenesis protein